MGPVNESTIVSDVGHQMTNAGERGQEFEGVKELILDLEQKKSEVLAEALERLVALDQKILSLEKSSGHPTLDIQEDVRPEFLDLNIQEDFEQEHFGLGIQGDVGLEFLDLDIREDFEPEHFGLDIQEGFEQEHFDSDILGPEFLDRDIQEDFEAPYFPPASLTFPDTGSDGAGGSDKSGNDSGGYGISRNERLKVRAELEGEEQYQTPPSHQRSKIGTVKRRGYICPILKEGCPHMPKNGGFRNFAELKYLFNSCP